MAVLGQLYFLLYELYSLENSNIVPPEDGPEGPKAVVVR
jgi:hypothetical protein